MGRPPIGRKAMTSTQRQKRYRRRKKEAAKRERLVQSRPSRRGGANFAGLPTRKEMAALIDLATLVTGPEPPNWLVQSLGHAVDYVGMLRGINDESPPPEKAASAITKLREAAAYIVEILGSREAIFILRKAHDIDAVMFGELLRDFGPLSHVLPGAVRHLSDLERSAARKRGRPRHIVSGGLSPRGHCALFAVHAWILVRGSSPGPETRQVQLACDSLWQLAGGNKATSLRSWAPRLRNALAARATENTAKLCSWMFAAREFA